MKENPIEKLLNLLPAEIAQLKREEIEADLKAADLWEHYRQRVRKPGYALHKTDVGAAQIFMRRLGVSLDFFTARGEKALEVHQREIARIVRQHYKETEQTLQAA
ncbi:hypothetical protein [Tellurirhabdus rosea]|uniref:hypothetical protein n=1 Tax=Tellurirhabdus rosea TaxID=2674997 RepID=UPI002256C5D8|nr:hypothetical protein [Tellurirhabdus rosea]